MSRIIKPEVIARPDAEYILYDLDGTLNDLDGFQVPRAIEHFGKEQVSPTEYDVRYKFGVSRAEREKFWLKNILEYCTTHPAREDASDVVHESISIGLTPVLFTARVFVNEGKFSWKRALGPAFRSMVLKWMEQENIPITPENIYWCSEKYSARAKLEGCKVLQPRWAFEEKADNILLLSQSQEIGTHVLVPREDYNRGFKETDRLTYIGSLTEGLEIVKEEMRSRQ